MTTMTPFTHFDWQNHCFHALIYEGPDAAGYVHLNYFVPGSIAYRTNVQHGIGDGLWHRPEECPRAGQMDDVRQIAAWLDSHPVEVADARRRRPRGPDKKPRKPRAPRVVEPVPEEPVEESVEPPEEAA